LYSGKCSIFYVSFYQDVQETVLTILKNYCGVFSFQGLIIS